jgi:hypothetical protein
MAVLAAAFFLLQKVPSLTPAHRELLLVSPYLVAVTGMFLSVHFHRGRPFTALLLVCILYFACRDHLGDGINGIAHQGLYLGLSLLLPFNFALLAVMREKGVFSVAGRLRFGFVLVQAASLWLLFRHYFEELLPLLTRKLLPLALLDTLLLPQPLLILSALFMVIIAFVTAKRQTPVESGLLGALIAVVIALAKITSPDVPALFCSAAGVII